LNIELAPAGGRDKNSNNSNVIRYFIRLIITMFGRLLERKKVIEFLFSKGYNEDLYSRSFRTFYPPRNRSSWGSKLPETELWDTVFIWDWQKLYKVEFAGNSKHCSLKMLKERISGDNKDYLEMFL
jgi:hypothetical protein